MKRRSRFSGFTLVELLVGVAIYTGILGGLLSVIGALRSSQLFRDNYSVVTQAASFAYEPLTRSLKAANAVETLYSPSTGSCLTMKGFYMLDNNQPIAIFNLASNEPVALGAGQKVVAISQEKTYDAGAGGNSYRWVKREYELADNQPDETGTIYKTVVETTYDAIPLTYEWPTALTNCVAGSSPNLHWILRADGAKSLTSNRSNVTRFAVKMAAPLVDAVIPTEVKSPFITLEIVAANPKAPTTPPYTLRSTIVPTFSYGEIRE